MLVRPNKSTWCHGRREEVVGFFRPGLILGRVVDPNFCLPMTIKVKHEGEDESLTVLPPRKRRKVTTKSSPKQEEVTNELGQLSHLKNVSAFYGSPSSSYPLVSFSQKSKRRRMTLANLQKIL